MIFTRILNDLIKDRDYLLCVYFFPSQKNPLFPTVFSKPGEIEAHKKYLHCKGDDIPQKTSVNNDNRRRVCVRVAHNLH